MAFFKVSVSIEKKFNVKPHSSKKHSPQFQLLVLTTVLAIVTCSPLPNEPGYSFSKFSGPVSGHAEEIKVDDKDGKGHAIDYDAKPDYSFEFGVEDPNTHVFLNRKEERHGDETQGEYSVVLPDGKTLAVKYVVDPHHGFQAKVYIDGHLQWRCISLIESLFQKDFRNIVVIPIFLFHYVLFRC